MVFTLLEIENQESSTWVRHMVSKESTADGRQSAYASNGYGGNVELKELDPAHFQFSIFEIVSATATADSVIDCENRWKEKLGSRSKDFGLNRN